MGRLESSVFGNRMCQGSVVCTKSQVEPYPPHRQATARGRALAYDSLLLKGGHHCRITGIKLSETTQSTSCAESIVLSHRISETGRLLGYGMFHGTESAL